MSKSPNKNEIVEAIFVPDPNSPEETVSAGSILKAERVLRNLCRDESIIDRGSKTKFVIPNADEDLKIGMMALLETKGIMMEDFSLKDGTLTFRIDTSDFEMHISPMIPGGTRGHG